MGVGLAVWACGMDGRASSVYLKTDLRTCVKAVRFFSDLRVLQLQKIYRTRDRTAVRGLVGGRLPPTSTGNRCTVGSHWYGVLVHIRTAVLVLDGWKQYT